MRDAAVSVLAQDTHGFLWVGMPDGLQRFDGYAFKRYPLGSRNAGASDQFVRALLADSRGGLWVAAGNSGLARLDTASGQWAQWKRADGQPADSHAPISNSIRALALDSDGSLWVGTQGGLSRLDRSQQFQHLQGRDSGLPDNRIASLLLDRHGTLWIGTWQGLARKLRGSDSIEAVDLGLGKAQITLLAETRDGRVLAGTGRGDLRMLSPDARPLPFAGHAGPDDGSWPVLSMVQVSDTELWLGGRNGIERRRAGDGELIERLPAEGGNPAPTPRSEVRALLRDPAGVIWTGSYGSGLMRHVPPLPGLSVVQYDLARWQRFGDLDVRSVLQLADRSIWLGTQAAGVLRLNEALEPVGEILEAGPAHARLGRIGAMAQTAAGAIWMGVENELLRLDAQGRWEQTVSTGQALTRRLLVDRGGSLWVGTSDGLWRLAPGAKALQPVQLAGKPGARSIGEVNALVQLADDSVWAGGAAGLLRVAQPGAADPPTAQLLATEGLVGHTVVGMALDREGRLWVDTSAGLHRLLTSTAGQARFEAFPQASGDEVVGAFGANLLADRDGRIWTHRGLFDPRSGMHRAFTPVDGVDFGNGWFRAYAELADGRFIFGGARGLLVAQPERFTPWTFQPPVVATELRVAGQSRPLPNDGQTLELMPGQRSFNLSFAALDYSQPARNRYRYRLDGLDDDWQEVGAAERTATYTNLEPGTYRLHVQGSNRDGAWSPHELQVRVRVDATWWQWRSVQALALVAAAALLLAIVRLRMRLLLRRQQQLEARVAEATAALQQKSRELEEASLTDPLTGLRNRRFVEQHLPIDVALALRRHESVEHYGHHPSQEVSAGSGDLLFFLVDIDHFKRINDSLGHMAGDAVLTQMRGRLQQVFRATDYLVRWGGEEFLIVARGTPRSQAAELAERARQAVAGEDFVLANGERLTLTCSVGFAAFPLVPDWPRALDWRAAIDLTDAALYEAKALGRNAWVGLLDARADSEEALRRDSRQTLTAWADSGRLTLLKSR
ncbi:MAG: hypothetical protein DI603_06660 [Roseateles depolymerans]|uniref:diguanylate cyclase n=1 Tax=Roseateles depolymerans TaxID=76731 RepID=A0A2W5DSS5_9BURK|nr:MAG: hypothetical protein DI603_06660 [Roseateles depolymerans]